MKFLDTENEMMVHRGRGEEDGKLLFNGYAVLVLQDKKSSRDRWW